jgi:uncharacterized membrane protein (GlpM family)
VTGDLIEIGSKTLFGGVLVVLFALIAQTLSPKRFAGVLAAAPSVALASMIVTTIASGPTDARRGSVGMIAGAIGFVAYGLVAPTAMTRWGALKGAATALLAWVGISGAALPLLALAPAAASPTGSVLSSVAEAHAPVPREGARPRPSCDPGKLREVKPKDLLVRFLFGAGTSLVAGVLTKIIGPFLAGAFLAFPAILLASLTLVADEEGRSKARDDARGAAAGALGLIAFAIVGTTRFGIDSTPWVLLAASGAWAVVAFAAYGIAWRLGAGADEKS